MVRSFVVKGGGGGEGRGRVRRRNENYSLVIDRDLFWWDLFLGI